MENILLEKEQLGEEVINTSVQNNKSVCENSQMEDEKNTNDVAECTDGSAENHKPIKYAQASHLRFLYIVLIPKEGGVFSVPYLST